MTGTFSISCAEPLLTLFCGDSVTFNKRQIEKSVPILGMSFEDSLTLKLLNILNRKKSQKNPKCLSCFQPSNYLKGKKSQAQRKC